MSTFLGVVLTIVIILTAVLVYETIHMHYLENLKQRRCHHAGTIEPSKKPFREYYCYYCGFDKFSLPKCGHTDYSKGFASVCVQSALHSGLHTDGLGIHWDSSKKVRG